MDHRELIARLCKDLNIAQRIDKRLLPDLSRKVSPGQGVFAMIINGLGYTNRTLYMSHLFFASKPIEHLLDGNIQAKDLISHILAATLDDIAAYGSSELFIEVATEIGIELNLLPLFMQLLWVLPPLWLFPGLIPAQQANCWWLGNCAISTPISDRITTATCSPTPGMERTLIFCLLAIYLSPFVLVLPTWLFFQNLLLLPPGYVTNKHKLELTYFKKCGTINFLK